MMRAFLFSILLAMPAVAEAQTAPAATVNLPSRGGLASGDQAIYRARCGACHLPGGTGTLMLSRRVPKGQEQLEKRPDLEADYVKTVVRNGIASMPAITRVEVTDAELTAISRYLASGKGAKGSGQ